MHIEIKPYTADRIDDVVCFEQELRRQEDCWGWEINEKYLESVRNSFENPAFADAVSLLAYSDGNVIGRIDASLIRSRFDGTTKAYLDWICVLKSCRHQGVAQQLLNELKKSLKMQDVNSLVALTAANEEAQSFYKAVPDSIMRDTGIWIDIL